MGWIVERYTRQCEQHRQKAWRLRQPSRRTEESAKSWKDGGPSREEVCVGGKAGEVGGTKCNFELCWGMTWVLEDPGLCYAHSHIRLFKYKFKLIEM